MTLGGGGVFKSVVDVVDEVVAVGAKEVFREKSNVDEEDTVKQLVSHKQESGIVRSIADPVRKLHRVLPVPLRCVPFRNVSVPCFEHLSLVSESVDEGIQCVLQ